MREHLDECDKITEIRMLFTHDSYRNLQVIVVEGTTDIRLFRGFFENEDIKLEPMDGKKPLLKVMRSIVQEYPGKVVAICDADFDRLFDTHLSYEELSVYATDWHDSEMMMLNSGALISFVNEYSKPESVRLARNELLNNATEAAYDIGMLRYINEFFSLNLNFKGLKFSDFILVNGFNVRCDVSRLIDILVQRSSNITIRDGGDFLLYYVDNFSKDISPLHICCGHDVANVISCLYRQPSISYDPNINVHSVERSLRLSYVDTYFFQTELYQNINNFLSMGRVQT
ncbi:DUF4435 domain-containing protein [Cobetia marina]|uniref:DUF4435 domain-containing protein n=1 Tax=Cobetia marina TaxID=28258 RepID=UPI00384E0796